MSAFRALAEVHVQGTWNRLQRRNGLSGARATVVVFVLLGVLLVVPLAMSMGLLGFLLGRALAGSGSPNVPAFAGLGFSLLTFGSGAMSGFTSGSRQLPWETLRGFPVRSFTIFRAELFAGLGEAMTLIEVGALLVVCGAAAIGAPRAAPLFLVLFLTHAVTLLAVQQLFGSVAQRFSRRFRTMLFLLPVTAISVPWAVDWLAERTDPGRISGWAGALRAGTVWLPARMVLDAARGILTGTTDAPHVLAAVVVPTVVAAAITSVAFVLVSRERPLTVADPAGSAARLWSFRSPVVGVARLQWESLVRSLPGRFGLLMPLFTLVLVRGPLAGAIPGHGWTAPAAFGYASLAGMNLLFNQFGLDRHGVKVLFLLPIAPGTLLRGKLLGYAGWQGLQAAMLFVLLAVAGHRDLVELLVGVALYACIFLVLWMVGTFASIWQPRPLRQNGLRAGQLPLVVAVVMFGTFGVTATLLYGVTGLLHRYAPGWELAGLTTIALGLGALVVPSLVWNTRYLVTNRERLVETLGSAG